MKRNILFSLIVSLGVLSSPAMAQNNVSQNTAPPPVKPHGCLAYGAGGAVGGHFVGKGHAFLGSLVGCAYGWHKKHEWKKEMKAYNKEHPKG